MNKIIIPQSNPNDEFVFITEWKFENNDYVKKGDHVLSIETSKVIEEIYSECEGYLEKLFQINTKVKIGTSVAFLNNKKKDIKEIEKDKKNNTTFTKKAELMIKKHHINIDEFKAKQIVKESDVLKYIENKSLIKITNKLDQLLILEKDKQPYHAALFLENQGVLDLSLMGSKVTKLEEYNFAECKCNFYSLNIPEREKTIHFLHEPSLLTEKIIKKERSSRGWFKKSESADYILNFRNKRSKNSNDMNCIEWLVYGLELGGLDIPENVLTASLLKDWASKKQKKIEKNNNLVYLMKYY